MAINKVQFGNTTLIDLTDTTALAADVAQGKYFYLATGEKVQGTATGGGGAVWQDQDGYVHLSPDGSPPITVESLSVTQNGTYTAPTGKAYSPVTVNVSGGGGLVYETGTWTPTEDVADYTISFANTHSTAPWFYMIDDATNTYINTATNFLVIYSNFNQQSGAILYRSATNLAYGFVYTRYRASTGASDLAGTVTNIDTPYTSTDDSTNTNSRYWATETGIRAYTNATSRYWRSNRTYKWIAIWAPTT